MSAPTSPGAAADSSLPDFSLPPDKQKPAVLAKAFACPNCGATVELRAAGWSVTAVCPNCRSVIDTANENLNIIASAAAKQKVEPLIPISTRGELAGVTWEVIGFVVRCDGSNTWFWEEYLLFNPYRGFRWLVVNQGHFNFVTMLKDWPSGFDTRTNPVPQSVAFGSRSYKLFTNGTARVTYVYGEFYWRVTVNDKVEGTDYVFPPLMLSREKDAGETTWSGAEYVTGDVIQNAFNIPPAKMPQPRGIAPNQPSPYDAVKPRMWWMTGIFLGLLILVEIIGASSANTKTVFQKSFTYVKPPPGPSVAADNTATPGNPDKDKLVTDSFELTEKSNVGVIVEAPLTNSWMDFDIMLVDAKTEQVRPLFGEISYYSGYDSEDGNWTEGSQSFSDTIAQVPPGTYYLTIDVDADDALPQATYAVTVHQGEADGTTFVFLFIILCCFPAYFFWRSYTFESTRWSDSDD